MGTAWKFEKKDYGIWEDIFAEDALPIIGFVLLIAVIYFMLKGLLKILIQGKRDGDLIGLKDYNTYKHITVKAKLIDINEGNLSNKEYMGTPPSVLFELEDGTRKTFYVKSLEDGWRNFVIGDKGNLTYAGRAFVRFELIKDENE